MLAGDQYVACGGIDSLGSLGLGDALLASIDTPGAGSVCPGLIGQAVEAAFEKPRAPFTHRGH